MVERVILRQANLPDVKAITDIYLASRRTFVSYAVLAHSEDSIIQWIREILIPSNQLTVAEEKNKIVGMMSLSKKEGIGWIDQLYLSPDAVGRGIGTLLLNSAISTLGSPIRLRTFQANLMARRFYEKNGFHALEFSDGLENEEQCPDVLYEWKV